MTRKPSRPGTPVTAVGWNCTNSRSASAAPAARASSRPDAAASPAGWSCATTAPRRRRWRGSSRGRRTARAVLAATTPTQRPSRVQQRGGAGALEDRRCAGPRRRRRRELAHDAPARSRCRRRGRRGGASGRPRGRARGCRGGRRRSARRALEVARRASGASRAQDLGGAAAHEPAAGELGVVEVAGRASRRRRARRRARPGPSSWRRLGERRGGDERHARAGARGASARRRGRRAPAPTTATSRGRGRGSHRAVRVSRVAAPAPGSTIPRRWRTTPARPPRAARADRRDRARAGARATGSAASASSRRRRRASSCAAVHPPAARRAIEALCAARRRARSTPTPSASPASYEAALRGAGGACALVDALLGGEAPCGVSAHRPPGHHAEAGAGDGLLPVQQRRGRGAARARRPRRRARADPRLGRPPRQRDQRRSSTPTRRCCSSRSTSRRCIPGTGPARDVGLGAGRGLHGQPAGAAAARATQAFASLVEHVVVPLVAGVRRRGWCSISAGFDAHADDPLAGCEVTEEGFAAMAALAAALRRELGVPVGLVLEGGYDLEALARSVRGAGAGARPRRRRRPRRSPCTRSAARGARAGCAAGPSDLRVRRPAPRSSGELVSRCRSQDVAGARRDVFGHDCRAEPPAARARSWPAPPAASVADVVVAAEDGRRRRGRAREVAGVATPASGVAPCRPVARDPPASRACRRSAGLGRSPVGRCAGRRRASWRRGSALGVAAVGRGPAPAGRPSASARRRRGGRGRRRVLGDRWSSPASSTKASDQGHQRRARAARRRRRSGRASRRARRARVRAAAPQFRHQSWSGPRRCAAARAARCDRGRRRRRSGCSRRRSAASGASSVAGASAAGSPSAAAGCSPVRPVCASGARSGRGSAPRRAAGCAAAAGRRRPHPRRAGRARRSRGRRPSLGQLAGAGAQRGAARRAEAGVAAVQLAAARAVPPMPGSRSSMPARRSSERVLERAQLRVDRVERARACSRTRPRRPARAERGAVDLEDEAAEVAEQHLAHAAQVAQAAAQAAAALASSAGRPPSGRGRARRAGRGGGRPLRRGSSACRTVLVGPRWRRRVGGRGVGRASSEVAAVS